ncbi:tripartite motif-containing protein 2-like [Glandiceps talaboti]
MASVEPDVDSFLKSVEETFLLCSICLCHYNKAKILPCYHTFCQECLNALVRKTGQLFCPTCRAHCDLPPTGTAGLPMNGFMNSLVELAQSHSKSLNQRYCGGCHGNSPTYKCIDCDEKLCSSCTDIHKQLRLTAGHTVDKITVLLEDTSTHLNSSKVIYCDIHTANAVQSYCNTCECLICEECTRSNHKTPAHEHRGIQDALDECTTQFRHNMKKLKHRESEVDKCRATALQTVKLLETQFSIEESKINMKAEDVIRKVKEEAKTLISELREMYSSKIKVASVQLDEWERKKENISQRREYLETLVHHGSNVKLLSSKHETEQFIGETLSMKDGYPSNPELVEFEAIPDFTQHTLVGYLTSDASLDQTTITNIPRKVIEGNKAIITITTKDSHGRQVIPRQKVFAEVTAHLKPWTDVRVRNNRDGTHSLSIQADTEGLYEAYVSLGRQRLTSLPIKFPVVKRLIKTLGNGCSAGNIRFFKTPISTAVNKLGDFITADAGNFRVQILDKGGNFKSSIACEKFQKPFIPQDIAIADDDAMFVSDKGNNQIVVTGDSGRVVQCFGGKELKNPRGIAINHADDTVYVTDWDAKNNRTTNREGHCVKKYTQSGQFLKSFGRFGAGVGEFRGPNFVATNKQGMVYVSDFNNDRVQVFNVKCNFMFSFGTSGTKDGQLNRPTGLTIDKEGNIFVCEQEGNRVQKFDGRGRFICRVDRDEDGLNKPQGIAFIDDESIAVVDSLNHCIKLFAV